MSVTPRITLVAWEDRQGNFVFVADPSQRGRYIRTDRSVLQVECPLCKAAVGEPCKTIRHKVPVYAGLTHYIRRREAQYLFPGQTRVDDLIDQREPEPASRLAWPELPTT